MELTYLIILLALTQYLLFTLKAGTSRPKFNINAPKTSGDETWERLFRVQQNTLEQLIVFVPAMLAFSYYISQLWVVIPGVAFLIGRQLYAAEYVKDPTSRVPGFTLTFFSNVALLLGGISGLIYQMLI